MRGATLFVIGSLFLTATAQDDYNAAISAHNGNAIVLLVQDGCVPCMKLEDDLLPILRQSGMLEDSTIAIISVNKQPKLVRRLQGSELNARRGFPVMYVFRSKEGKLWGWRTFGYAGPDRLVQRLQGIQRWQPPARSK